MPTKKRPSGQPAARGDADGIDTSRHPAAAERTPPAARGARRGGRMLAPDRALKLAEQHGVLADVIRLQLLHLIASHPDGEVRAGVLAARVGRAPSTVSHHLALLLDAGLVRRRRQGRERLYRPTAAGHRAAAIISRR